MAKTKAADWLNTVPDCLAGDICDAADLLEAIHLARIQLDLIQEGQDGTEHYTPKDVAAIKAWIVAAKKLARQTLM